MSFVQHGEWQPFDQAGRRKYVNTEERRRFLTEADKLAPQMRALCRTLALTGCRVSEALALTRDRIDVDAGRLIFRTLKRRKRIYRLVPVPPALIAMLLALPENEDGRVWNTHRSTAWRHVKCVMDAAGIRGPMSCPKGLRHGFGMCAATRQVPPNLIQKWLGHASIETTAIYLDAVGIEEEEFAKRTW